MNPVSFLPRWTVLAAALLAGVAPTVQAAGENYPFPQSITYPHGIKPTNYTQAQMNTDLQSKYNQWRSLYLTTNGCAPGEMRVYCYPTYGEGQTISEGQGYGLVLSVYMANGTNTGREDFDALYRYVQRYRLPDCGLMSWKISADGLTADTWSAPDGDIDIAFALVMAHRQWGSDGAINYLAEAQAYIANLMTYAVNKTNWNISNAQFADTSLKNVCSYQIPYAFKVFHDVSGDSRWINVIEAAYDMFGHFQTLNPATGLVPNVCRMPTYVDFGDGNLKYGYDASRIPWRVAVDYLWHGQALSPLAQALPLRNTTWFHGSTGGVPSKHYAEYKLNGQRNVRYGSPGNMVGPMAVAAMVDPGQQAWLNTLYDYLVGRPVSYDWPSGYYQDSVLLMTLLTLTGNFPDMWNMPPAPPPPPPPVNLALNQPVTASSVSSGYVAANAVDGNGGTRWASASSDPQWIQVDLGSVRTVSNVRLQWEAAYGKAYQIQVSADGTTWTTVAGTSTGDGGLDDLSFTPTPARYVRLYGTARGTRYGYSLWEFEVY